MNRTTEKLHDIGQSIWLDNITHRLLASGTLLSYIRELSVTGLTSNPTIFDHAIKNSNDYDDVIRRKLDEGKSGEVLFFELALEDLRQAADLFRPVYDRTDGVDGWVSLEVSPLLAHNTAGTLAAARALHNLAARPNLFIKIPGTSEGLPAIEEAIFAGIPVNVTLLFSSEQYGAAAEAYLCGIERRIAAGLNPDVDSVASLFVSRWDVAVAEKVPESLRNQLGIAIAREAYVRYRALLDSPRWQRILNEGARPQRLLWASTGTKDPNASDILYVEALALPSTVNTMPEATLKALAAHEELGQASPSNPGEILAEFAKAGIDTNAVAAQLLGEGVLSFAKSWRDLLDCIASKSQSAQGRMSLEMGLQSVPCTQLLSATAFNTETLTGQVIHSSAAGCEANQRRTALLDFEGNFGASARRGMGSPQTTTQTKHRHKGDIMLIKAKGAERLFTQEPRWRYRFGQ